MGVHGLWRLIEPSGKPVPLETLENKVLAVDISIWLHQAVKGFQDAKGGPVPNAHLLGIYHRVCKLLYFKIKPVFVFDGGVPALKKQTIAKRNQLKSRNTSDADKLQKQLLSTLLKHTAISKVLSEKTKASITAHTKKSPKNDNLYVLPDSGEMDSTLSSSEEEECSEETTTTDSSPTKQWDIHTIDTKSDSFKSLPIETRHEILTELKDTRKQSSWGRLHELPKQSDDFATYQMKRLLNRQAVQAALDEAAKEMGGASLSLAELESLLEGQGIHTIMKENVGKHIASDENTRYLYIRSVKEALEKARQQERQKNDTGGDSVEEQELEKAIALSLQEVPGSSAENRKEPEEDFKDADFASDSSEDDCQEISAKQQLSSAQSYMMEYSGLTLSEISKILEIQGKRISRNDKTEQKLQDSNEKDSETVGSKVGIEGVLSEDVNKSNIVIQETNRRNDSSEILGKAQRKNVNSHEAKTNQKGIESQQTSDEPSVRPQNKADVEEQQELERAIALSLDTVEIAQEEEELEITEIMSDSGESSVEDLVDVQEIETPSTDTSESQNVQKKSALELLIIPQNRADDDLFGDIFEDKADVAKLEDILKKGLNAEGMEDKIVAEKVREVSGVIERSTKTRVEDRQREKLGNTQEREDNFQKSTEQVKERGVTTSGTIEQKEKEDDYMPDRENGVKNPSEESKTAISDEPILTVEDMRQLKNDLQQEKIDLMIEKSTKERMGSNITDQMYQEAQELLELFGVPYVTAPMEAEAQCAFLEEIQLTDGTITDDSDIWLFGGRTVYKNFFNQAKYVMEFKSENIEHQFKLSRKQLILLALLVGSDYTVGIQGVGPVTALEILSVFPPVAEIAMSHQQLVSGLREFKSWFHQDQIRPGPGRSSLKSKLKNVTFAESFPNAQVIQAYMEPAVETSRGKFTWAKPDTVALSLLAREKFGWSCKKADDILNPVIRRMEENRMQRSIKDFFKTKFKLDSGNGGEKMSKRVRSAIGRMGKTREELIAEEMENLGKKTKGGNEGLEGEQPNEKRRKRKASRDTDTPTSGEVKMGKETAILDEEDSNKKAKKPRTRTVRNKDKNQTTQNKDTTGTSSNQKNFGEIEDPAEPDTLDGESNKPRTSRRRKEGQVLKKPEPLSKQVASLPSSSTTSEELRLYEDVAAELKMRRQHQTELAEAKKKKQARFQKKKKTVEAAIPEELREDKEIQHLLATTSTSADRVAAIQKEASERLLQQRDRERAKRLVPGLHAKEVIHQKLRDRSDLLRNKMKAIEVFRKSKRGPGYVGKSKTAKIVPKEDAGLSEDSGDD